MTEQVMDNITELEMICNLCNSYNKDQANLRSRHLDEKGRVKVKGCCRCRSLTDFPQEKYIEMFCRHERCHDCLKFNGGRQKKATMSHQEIQEPPSCVIRNCTVDSEPQISYQVYAA